MQKMKSRSVLKVCSSFICVHRCILVSASPTDVCLVPGHKVVMFVLQNGSICFWIPEHSKLTATKRIFKAGVDATYKAAFGGFGPYLCLAILSTYGDRNDVKFIKFPPFEQLAQGSTEFFEGVKLLKTVSNLTPRHLAGDKDGFAFVSPFREARTLIPLVPEAQRHPDSETTRLCSSV